MMRLPQSRFRSLLKDFRRTAGLTQSAGPPNQRAALAGCAWLAPLLPEFVGLLEPLPTLAGSLAPERERRQIHAAVAYLPTNIAGPAGTLLVLDDLQWAGPDALDLLAAHRDAEVRPAHPR
jgi:hypothetical protein